MITEFLLIDLGYKVGLACLIIGLLDLVIGGFWLRKKQHRDQLEQFTSKPSELLRLLIGFDLFLTCRGVLHALAALSGLSHEALAKGACGEYTFFHDASSHHHQRTRSRR